MRIYEYSLSDEKLEISRNGRHFMNLSNKFCVNGKNSDLKVKTANQNTAVLVSEFARLEYTFNDECIILRAKMFFEPEEQIFDATAFSGGIDIVNFDRCFCPQPRRNATKNTAYYHNLPDLSLEGYFTPPALVVTLGNADGLVSFGLLDLPDTKTIRIQPDMSYLVESCGGNKKCGENGVYNLPSIIIAFPEDDLSSITQFRENLIKYTSYTPKEQKFSDIPSWWRNPMVCIYGDQINESKVGDKIDREWVLGILDEAEKVWGMEHINFTIDDSWQPTFAMEPLADEKRFPDFREMIDSIHDRGHKVILWQPPLFEKTTNGFETRAQRLGVISDYLYDDDFYRQFPGSYAIDYTSDNAREFIRQYVTKLFSDAPGCYNADGIKMDFLGILRDPAETKTYAHPERGIGLTELKLFFEMFYEEAHKVKPDVIVNSSVGDPRFDAACDMNRMHDTHAGVYEKEMRAQISIAGCPNLPIDSDGALMHLSWLKDHYINAAIYAIPANYYTRLCGEGYPNENGGYIFDKYSDRRELSENEKKAMGRLFALTRFRPDGVPQKDGDTRWILKAGDKVNGVAVNGDVVVYFPWENSVKGYIFSLTDQAVIIPLYNHKFSKLTPAPERDHLYVDYARDRVNVRLKPGVVYEFEDFDDGSSIDAAFLNKNAKKGDEKITYVN